MNREVVPTRWREIAGSMQAFDPAANQFLSYFDLFGKIDELLIAFIAGARLPKTCKHSTQLHISF